MISLSKLDSASDAVKYYLNVVEYYGDGHWMGEGAKDLNIHSNVVGKDMMLALLQGTLPNGQQLGRTSYNKDTGEQKNNHRSGFDITLSMPKMVSILIETKADPDLEKAFKETVTWLSKQIEKEFAEARTTNRGATIYEKTANLVMAGFQHPDSRAGDPETHFHMVVMNMTKCKDGKYRSLSSDMSKEHGFYEQLWKQRNYLGLQARNYMLNKVKELGKYDIIQVGDGLWDIGLKNRNLYQTITEYFSKQSSKIKEYMDEKGWHSSKAKAEANSRTRESKVVIADLDAWREDIKNQCKQMGLDPEKFVKSREDINQGFLPRLKQRLFEKIFNKDEVNAIHGREAIEFAVSVLSQREAVFSEKSIKEEALKHAINNQANIGNEQIDKALIDTIKDGSLYKATPSESDERRYTTPWQLTIESETQARIKNGQNACDAICSLNDVNKALKQIHRNSRFTPTETQRTAIESFLTSNDRFIAIQGFAGTGKTKMMSIINDIASEHGVELMGASASATATDELTTKGGIHSDVLIKKLSQLENNKHSLKDTVLVLDEASMVSSQHFHLITKLIEQRGGRLCFLGDKDQCPSPSAGKDFELTQNYSDKTVYVTSFIRFKDENLKQAATSIVNRDFADAFDNIKDIKELDTHAERIGYIAKTWLSWDQKQRDDTYLIALSHKQRKEITEIIRDELVSRGELSKNEIEISCLARDNLAEKKLRDAKYYREGQVLLFNKTIHASRIQFGEYLTIGDISQKHLKSNSLPLIRENGRKITFKLKDLPEFDKKRSETDRPIELYNKSIISLREGDRVMWKKNNSKLDIKNAVMGKVISMNGENIEIGNNDGSITVNKKDKALMHIDHGYVITINASQGKDRPYAMFLDESYNPYGTTFANTYVPLTRAMNKVIVVTDNKERLLQQIELSKNKGKSSALECVSAETLNHHYEKFKYHSKSLDISEVISKKAELDKEQQKIEAMVERYRELKESGNNHQYIKQAKTISLNKDVMLLARKRLSYSSNEIAGDVLKFDTAKLVASLRGNERERFLMVKDYVNYHQKAVQLIKKIKSNEVQGGCTHTNKEKMYELANKRNELAYKICNNINDHKRFLAHYSIGKANRNGYLDHDKYKIQEKALGKLETLAKHAEKYKHSLRVKAFINANGDEKLKIASEIKAYSSKSHPYIIKEAKLLGINEADLWKEINFKAKEHSNNEFRATLNPVDKSLFDKLNSFKKLNIEISQESLKLGSSKFNHTDKISQLMEKKNQIAASIDLKAPNEISTRLNIDIEKLSKSAQKADIKAIVHRYSDKANFKQKRALAVQILQDIKLFYPELKRQGVDTRKLNKLIRIEHRKDYLSDLSDEEKRNYKDVIKYRVLSQKSAYLWKEGLQDKQAHADIRDTKTQNIISKAALLSAKRDELAFKINSQTHHIFCHNENINHGKLLEHARKHQARIKNTTQLNSRAQSLIKQFHQSGISQNKHLASAWYKAWNQLNRDVKRHENSAAYKANIANIKVETRGIKSLNKTIMQMGYKYDNKAHNPSNTMHLESKSQQKFQYDLNRINEVARDNPAEIYTQIFGAPKRKSSTELRYSGGLIVTLKGSKQGLWYDHSEGQGGSIIQAIQKEQGIDFKDAIKVAASITGVTELPYNSLNISENRARDGQIKRDIEDTKHQELSTKSAKSIWSGCIGIKGSLAERYLKEHRNIENTARLQIKYWPVGARWINVTKDNKVEQKVNKTPALVVAAKDINGNLKAVQRTYLCPKTAGKNHYFEQPKLAKGSIKNNFCILQKGKNGSNLFIAEGVETAASIAQSHPYAHILVSFGQANMANAADIIRKLNPHKTYIAADNDGLKEPSESIKKATISLRDNGIESKILMPDMLDGQHKTDWNDVLKAKGVDKMVSDINLKIIDKYSNIDVTIDDSNLAKTINSQQLSKADQIEKAKQIEMNTQQNPSINARKLAEKEMEI